MIFVCDSITAERPLTINFLFEESVNGNDSDCQFLWATAVHSLLSFPVDETVNPGLEVVPTVQGAGEAHLMCLVSGYSLSSAGGAQSKWEFAWSKRELVLVKAPIEISVRARTDRKCRCVSKFISVNCTSL